jgi:hypothetical protein
MSHLQCPLPLKCATEKAALTQINASCRRGYGGLGGYQAVRFRRFPLANAALSPRPTDAPNAEAQRLIIPLCSAADGETAAETDRRMPAPANRTR